MPSQRTCFLLSSKLWWRGQAFPQVKFKTSSLEMSFNLVLEQRLQGWQPFMLGNGVMDCHFTSFSEKVSIAAVNRQCSSGLQAVASIAGAIKAGYIDVGIGVGVESMTHYYGPQAIPTNL